MYQIYPHFIHQLDCCTCDFIPWSKEEKKCPLQSELPIASVCHHSLPVSLGYLARAPTQHLLQCCKSNTFWQAQTAPSFLYWYTNLNTGTKLQCLAVYHGNFQHLNKVQCKGHTVFRRLGHSRCFSCLGCSAKKATNPFKPLTIQRKKNSISHSDSATRGKSTLTQRGLWTLPAKEAHHHQSGTQCQLPADVHGPTQPHIFESWQEQIGYHQTAAWRPKMQTM